MRAKRKRTAKSNKNFMKIAVIAVLVQVFVYTWAHLILSFIVGVEIAPTVSCAFYAFCGTEAGFLAYLKSLDKKRKEDTNDETADYSETYEP